MAQHREKPFKDGGDDRRAMIVKNFRCGARRPWCRLVWKSAIEACGGTQDAAAQRLFVTTSAVSEGLQHGRLSIDCLVVMMAELAADGWRPPKLPPRDEMADEGLIEAMAYLRDPEQIATKRRRISRDELAVLSALLADKQWIEATADYERAHAAADPVRVRRADATLTALAQPILATASRRRGCVIHRNVDRLLDLARNWSAAWTACRDAIPFAWSEAA